MPVPKKKETYSQAMARLEKIVNQIDNIIAFCESKLTKADREIEKILAEKQESEE